MDFSKSLLKLRSLSQGNETYAHFNKKIVNTKKQVWGVRMPDMRKMAKIISKDLSVLEIEQLLAQIDEAIFEQVLLFGLVISSAKIPEFEKVRLTKQYLDLVDSWAEVDVFVARAKRKEPLLWWDLARESLTSDKEFVVRYGVIEMMTNFLDDEHLETVFECLRMIKHDSYYVKMAMAWLYATAAVKFYEKTLQELEVSEIVFWVKKKAHQKMLESRRFNSDQRNQIRKIKQKLFS